jgi:antitoxin component YwqK of YwqJK toxin-antitoxin module
LWLYFGWEAFSNAQSAARTANENYHAVRDLCIIKDGVNRQNIGRTTKEFECKDGVLNGFTKTYNAQDTLIYEAHYLNGKLNGTETAYYDNGKVRSIINYKDGNREGVYILYKEDGNTDQYMIYEEGKTRPVYYGEPEGGGYEGLDHLDQRRQKQYCENQGAPAYQGLRYSCVNNVINGEFVRYWPEDGTVLLRANFVNGVLDGVYEEFRNGKLSKHFEFRNGKLEGTVQGYSWEEGILEYEGHYTNGLQNGIFRRYNHQGNVESEVVFEYGQLVKINKLPPLSDIP